MTFDRHCPECGAALAADAPRGLCGRCLLNLALSAPEDDAALVGHVSSPLGRSFGGYELIEEIAHGGMGVVWRARQPNLNRTVALKLLRIGHASEADLARFRAEAEAAAALQHPNIVTVFEVGEIDGQPFLAMRVIEGGSLAERIAQWRETEPKQAFLPFEIRHTCELIAQVARAVHHAHQHGILHRDLKPSNILLDREGHPQVTDFGLAKRLAADSQSAARDPQLTFSGTVLGTPSYMAPEQALGRTKDLTTAADVYSLGAILYELLTGHPPFRGDSVVEILRQVVEEEPVPPSRMAARVDPQRRGHASAARLASIDRDLETICLKCLDKDPLRRYGSAEALAADLDRWLNHESVQARRASAWDHLAKWTRRRPGVAALTMTAIVLFIAGLSGIIWQSHVANNNARRAKLSADESLERLRNQQVANALQHLQVGDSFAAMLWFTEALSLDEGRADRVDNDRLRLASVQAQAPKLLHLWFPGGLVEHAEFSADGARLLLVSEGEGARVYDVASGNPLTPPLPHDGEGVKAHFLADGRRVFTVGGKRARVFSADTGELLWSVTNRVASADMSPDGERMVFSSDFWDLNVLNCAERTVRATEARMPMRVQSVRFSPDGRRVLILNHFGDRLALEADTLRKLTPQMRCPIILRDTRIVLAPFDGQRTLCAKGDCAIQVIDVATGQPICAPLQAPEPINHAVLSADGRWAATSTLNEVRLWNVATGQMIGQLPRVNAVVTSFPFSPDGTRLVTHSAQSGDEVRVWDVATARPLTPPLRHGGLITVTAFHPDSQRLVTAAADGTARLWDLRPSDPSFHPWTNETRGLILLQGSSDAFITQDQDGSMMLWDSETWQNRSLPFSSTNQILTVGIAPDRQHLVVIERRNSNCFAHRIDLSAGTIQSVELNSSWTWDCKVWISPDLTRAVVYRASKLTLHDLTKGEEIHGPYGASAGRVHGVAFSPDSKVVAFELQKEVHVLSFDSGDLLFPPLIHERGVSCLAFSGDGLRLATGSFDLEAAPCLARVWDAHTGQPITPPLLDRDGVLDIAFSPDGRLIATAHEDDVTRLWDTTSGRLVTAPLRHNERVVYRTIFSPDGRRLVTTSRAAAFQLWDALSGEPLTMPEPRPPNSLDPGLGETAQFLKNERELLTVNGGQVRFWRLPSDSRPIADIRLHAQLLCGQALDATGALEPLPLATVSNAWRTLRLRYP